ncbi:MAG: hypothetical protein JNJ52_05100 [Flavobacterium sp.]|nr:hypothetical protein [Flavobacterium sp.]
MKKLVLLVLIASFVVSCAPKRASCYGKRCVEHSIKKEGISNEKQNS